MKNPALESGRQRSNSLERALRDQPQAFLTDEQVGTSLFYRCVKFIHYNFACWFHALEVKGLEHLPPADKGALMIAIHSTHNQDIPTGLTALHAQTGRVPRGLLHRVLFQVHPYTKYLGLVPGQRNTAKHLLQSGFLTCVLPGGGEEAMSGHEHAYDLHPRWKDRRGFAHVAKDANVDIIPMFMANVEEMRFNPFFFLANQLGFTRMWQSFVDLRLPVAGWLAKQLGMIVWFSLAYSGIPVPVKTTLHLGKPILVNSEDSVDVIAERSRLALTAMIAKYQPHGHAYLPGLRERFALLKSKSV